MLSQKLSNAESRIQQAAKDHDAAIQLVAKSSEAKIAELHNLHAGQELSFRSSIEQLKEKLYRQQQIMGRKQMSEAVLMRDINKKFADLLSLKSPASEMLSDGEKTKVNSLYPENETENREKVYGQPSSEPGQALLDDIDLSTLLDHAEQSGESMARTKKSLVNAGFSDRQIDRALARKRV